MPSSPYERAFTSPGTSTRDEEKETWSPAAVLAKLDSGCTPIPLRNATSQNNMIVDFRRRPNLLHRPKQVPTKPTGQVVVLKKGREGIVSSNQPHNPQIPAISYDCGEGGVLLVPAPNAWRRCTGGWLPHHQTIRLGERRSCQVIGRMTLGMDCVVIRCVS